MYEYGIATGLQDVHFAPLIKDDETGATYEAPFKIGDSISVKPAFEFAEGSLDAENKTIRDDAELMRIKFQINTTRFSPEIQAKILGRKIDKNGGIVTKNGDVPPEGALLYRVTLDNNKSKYVCVYKGIFRDFAEEAQSRKRGSKDYQTPTIEFTAYRRADGLLRYEVSEEAEGYSKGLVSTWFDSVPEPDEDISGSGDE